MALKRKILFSLDGFLPSNNGGGPFRIVDYLIKGITPEIDADLEIGLLSKYGYFKLEELHKILSLNYASKPKLFLMRRSFEKFLNLIKSNNVEFNTQERLEKTYIKTHSEMEKRIKKLDINKIDIIHSHISGGAFDIITMHSFDARIITTYQSKGSIISDYKGSWKLDPVSSFAKYLRIRELTELLAADVLTFPSKAAFQLMKNDYSDVDFSKKDVRIIYNGIDIEKINQIVNNTKKLKSDKFVILNVAKHVSQKNIDVMLKALKLIKNEINFKFINIGNGVLLEKHKNMAKDLGLISNVEFIESLPSSQVIEKMYNSDIFVLTGQEVVFDLVVLEAMAVGLPVILSNNGGNLEAIKNQESGILVDINERELANAILFAYRNREKIKKFSVKAKEDAINKFSLNAMIKGYLKVYSELLEFD